MSKAVKIKIYKTVVKPFVVYGTDIWPMTVMYMTRLKTWEIYDKTEYMGEENIKEDIWTSGQGIWTIRTVQ
jgi:hypothetical protein